MTLYIFKCSSRQTRTGVTTNKTGANLPTNSSLCGNWIFWKTIDIVSGDIGRIGAPPVDEILSAIDRDGFYINDSSLEFTES
jgi:hypothetical protein